MKKLPQGLLEVKIFFMYFFQIFWSISRFRNHHNPRTRDICHHSMSKSPQGLLEVKFFMKKIPQGLLELKKFLMRFLKKRESPQTGEARKRGTCNFNSKMVRLFLKLYKLFKCLSSDVIQHHPFYYLSLLFFRVWCILTPAEYFFTC